MSIRTVINYIYILRACYRYVYCIWSSCKCEDRETCTTVMECDLIKLLWLLWSLWDDYYDHNAMIIMIIMRWLLWSLWDDYYDHYEMIIMIMMSWLLWLWWDDYYDYHQLIIMIMMSWLLWLWWDDYYDYDEMYLHRHNSSSFPFSYSLWRFIFFRFMLHNLSCWRGTFML